MTKIIMANCIKKHWQNTNKYNCGLQNVVVGKTSKKQE